MALLGFIPTYPPAALTLAALVTRAKADLTLGGPAAQTLTTFVSGTRRDLLTYEEGHQGTLCGRCEGVVSDEADGLLHYRPLEDGLEV